jgi:hypothetical protein
LFGTSTPDLVRVTGNLKNPHGRLRRLPGLRRFTSGLPTMQN